ncbi:hypothetical protein CGCF415_v013357 [Colletotrichum fructicola]|nr:hypothetical protein CGCF415_v013357 [Colletotrichum fructicola]KAF4924447.1 hypothetical protein CGCF245_v014519 [Colletotrichum fructicola]
MPVEETLDKLDPPAASAEETPRHLWDALKAGFRQYANLKEADFSRWALSNVDRKILKNAADSRLANEIKSLRPDFPSRYATVLTAFDVSLGILLQLFGFKVVSSRACNSSFIQLCKARPDLRIEELYDAWNTQPTVVNSRLISEITRFQRAANSVYANIASHSDPFGPLETPRSSVQRSALDFTLSPFEPESTNDRDTPPEVSSLPSYMAQSQGQEHDSDTSEDEFVDSAVYFDMDDETEQPVAETGQTNHGAASCHESQSSEKGSNLAKMVLDDIEHTDRIKRIRLRIAQDETYAAEASQKKNDSEECITELRRKTLARLQAIEDQNEGSLDEVDEEEDWYSISKAKADAMGHQEEIEKEMASSVRRKRVADRALGAEMKKRPRVAEAAQKLRDALQELENAVEEPLPPCE